MQTFWEFMAALFMAASIWIILIIGHTLRATSGIVTPDNVKRRIHACHVRGNECEECAPPAVSSPLIQKNTKMNLIFISTIGQWLRGKRSVSAGKKYSQKKYYLYTHTEYRQHQGQ